MTGRCPLLNITPTFAASLQGCGKTKKHPYKLHECFSMLYSHHKLLWFVSRDGRSDDRVHHQNRYITAKAIPIPVAITNPVTIVLLLSCYVLTCRIIPAVPGQEKIAAPTSPTVTNPAKTSIAPIPFPPFVVDLCHLSIVKRTVSPASSPTVTAPANIVNIVFPP